MCRPLGGARQIPLELGWQRPGGLHESAGEDATHRGALSFSWTAFIPFSALCLSSLLRHTQACFVFISTNRFYSKTNLPFIYGNLHGIALDKCGLNCPRRQYKCLFFVCFDFVVGFFSHTAILRRNIKPTPCMQTHFALWARGIRVGWHTAIHRKVWHCVMKGYFSVFWKTFFPTNIQVHCLIKQ